MTDWNNRLFNYSKITPLPTLLWRAGILLLVTVHCGQEEISRPVILDPSGPVQLEFQGKIEPAPGLTEKSFRVRFRVYNCSPEELLAAAKSKQKKPAGCLLRYSEKIVKTNTFSYKARVLAQENWTHAFVELLDLDEVRGKYSPGHNPFWFRKTKDRMGRKVALKHDIFFRSQENPLPDQIQEKFASRFAPIIVIKKDKQYLPSNLERYHSRYKIARALHKNNSPERILGANGGGHMDEPYMVLTEKKSPGKTHLYYHVRYADTLVSGVQAEALPGFRDNWNYYYRKGKGDIVISYWLWYDHNAGPTSYGNVHQGDLESFAVLADKAGRPLRFMATGHDHIMLDTQWHNINSVNHHPVIYIAHGNKGADGGNPTSAYGGYEVLLDAGNGFFNWLTDPRDIFPALDSPDSALIIPADLDAKSLTGVRRGSGEGANPEFLDLSGKVLRKIEKLIKWEEPGWVNVPADKDPDGHHRVSIESAWFMDFDGRLGKDPRTRMDYFRLTKFGESPKNAPFKINIEQHFTFERPRLDRTYRARSGDYGPKFKGKPGVTPQFLDDYVNSDFND